MIRRVSTPVLWVMLLAGVCLSYALVRADVKTGEPPKAAPTSMLRATNTYENGYTMVGGPTAGGMFVHRRADAPFGCLVSLPGVTRKDAIAVLGFGTSDTAVVDDGGFQFAVVTERTGVHLQIKGKDGKIHLLPVENLLKLLDKPE